MNRRMLMLMLLVGSCLVISRCAEDSTINSQKRGIEESLLDATISRQKRLIEEYPLDATVGRQKRVIEEYSLDSTISRQKQLIDESLLNSTVSSPKRVIEEYPLDATVSRPKRVIDEYPLAATVSRQTRMIEESLLDHEEEIVTVQPVTEEMTQNDLLPPESVTMVLAVLVPQDVIKQTGTTRSFDKPVRLQTPIENKVVVVVLGVTIPMLIVVYVAKVVCGKLCCPGEQPPQAPPNEVEMVMQAL